MWVELAVIGFLLGFCGIVSHNLNYHTLRSCFKCVKQ